MDEMNANSIWIKALPKKNSFLARKIAVSYDCENLILGNSG